MANQVGSDQDYSGVAQTANLGSSTSMSSGAAKIFREFKWGLLTLFILMAVVVCLVYDGGRNKKKDTAKPGGSGIDATLADLDTRPGTTDVPATNPGGTGGGTGGGVMTQSPGDYVAGGTDERPDLFRNDHPTAPGTRPGVTGNTPAAPGGATTGPLMRNRPGRIPDIGNDTAATNQPNENSPRSNRAGPRPAEGHDAARVEHNGVNAGFKIYVVKSGDSLSKIASENLPGKGGLKAITDANKETLPDVNRLREGMKLKIPTAIPSAPVGEIAGKTGTDRNSSRQGTSRPEAAHQANGGERHGSQDLITQDDYVVQPGDSLERIARKVLNDPRKWKNLMEWNKDRVSDEEKLKVGTVLRVHPPGASVAPVGTDGYRNRHNNAIRAESEYPAARDDAENLPNAEVVPIQPVAANSKAPAGQKSEKGAASKPAEPVTKGEPLPAD